MSRFAATLVWISDQVHVPRTSPATARVILTRVVHTVVVIALMAQSAGGATTYPAVAESVRLPADGAVGDRVEAPSGSLDGASSARDSSAVRAQPESFSCSAVTEIPQAECEALVALYNSTSGASWNNNTGWLNTNTPCSWYGVTCETGHVRDIDLYGNRLTGSIPTAVGSLANLQRLRLGDNQLSGSIPPQLGNLTFLRELNLYRNQLTGSIPAELGSLANLEYLALSDNRISGNIPPEMGALINLRSAFLGNNQLSGDIPPQLGSLTSLQDLNLNSNRLSGSIPAELANLANLQFLSLGGNQLSGNIPSELGSLANLRSLFLYSNQLSGNIPSELANLTNLQDLNLGTNQLTGSIPPGLGSLSSLQYLWLYGNQLAGSIPAQLGNLTNLEYLDLSVNQLSGVVPSELGRLTNLRDLVIYQNELSGSIPSELGNLARLLTLNLSGNQLSGGIPLELGDLSSLYELDLSGNQLTDSIPPELGNLASLSELILYQNQLSGAIPSELGNLTNLERLDLFTNQLSGSIPTQLGNLTNLEYLDLSRNQLSGGIPLQLGNLTNLERLDLFTNQLSGSIPIQLGNLANLEYLDLSRNQLSSGIPLQLGDLAFLSYLSLAENQLTGNIPVELATLASLTQLRLASNQLSGNIPPQLGNLTSLQYLDLESNQLSGSIPPALGNLANLRSLALNGNRLSGIIPTQLSGLTSLQELALQYNQLTGAIPVELANLINLQVLSLHYNQLTGNIPIELGNLTALRELFLTGNQLSGGVPTQLGNLTNLTELDLSRNQLSGSIPPQLGSLTNLVFLALEYNQLSGSIPLQLSGLTNLRALWLGGNQLTGSIPPELGNLTSLDSLSLDENQLSGGIPPQLGDLTNLGGLTLTGNQLTGTIPVELTNLTNLRNLGLGDNQLSGRIPAELGNLVNLQLLRVNGNPLLVGALPMSLTNLTAMTQFWFQNTSVCEPPSPAFQAWLASISDLQRNGVVCAVSSVVIEPAVVPTDGSSTGTITVTLRNADGDPAPGSPVEVALTTGANAFINGQPAGLNVYLAIGATDASGVVTATIRAEAVGRRSVQARSGPQVIEQQGVVDFVPGPISAAASSVTANPDRTPANGTTAATIAVNVRDLFGNPIPGVTVTLAGGGSAVVVQPAAPTDIAGRATGTITDSTVETVAVTAVANGIALMDDAVVAFRGADVAASLSAPTKAPPGATVTYRVTVRNVDLLTAANVSVTQTLPPGASFIDHTAPAEPVQVGNTLTWNVGSLAAHQQVAFTVIAGLTDTLPVGSALTSTLTVATTSPDANPGNNTALATTTIVDAYDFQASIVPGAAVVNLGGSAGYTIQVRNTGYAADTYALSISGLDAGWVSVNPPQVSLAPGGSTNVVLTVAPTGCQPETTLPFTATVVSSATAQVALLPAQVSLVQAPQILIDTPGNNTTSGARSVLFSWRTKPATSGMLTVYPEGRPGEAQVFSTPLGTTHAVQVEGLTRNQKYMWTARAVSACGAATSSVHSFVVGTGIVFTSRNPSFTIDRDYNQLINIGVRNDDVFSHTLLATIQNPHEDLIVNFVGSGSADESISLGPGQNRTLQLVVHAQDAQNEYYDLAAVITADEGTGVPLRDTTIVRVQVLSEFDVEVEEIGVDPVTGTRTYRVRNNGRTLSDLGLASVDPATGQPARAYISPNISHARLEHGKSLTFRMIPLFDARDVITPGGAGLADEWLIDAPITPGVIPANLVVGGAGQSQVVTASLQCSTGKVFGATLANVCLPTPAGDWYCTNRPKIGVPFNTPYFVDPAAISSADLKVTFTPRSNTLPHTTTISLNGTSIGTLANIVPSGTYWARVPSSALNTGLAGPVVQQLGLTSQHTNGGHYVVASDFVLGIGLNTVTAYVCANSQAEAEQTAIDTFGFESLSNSSVCSAGTLPAHMAWSASNDACIGAAPRGATEWTRRPINTRTGGMDYSFTDISIPTSAGPLAFQRWYASLATDAYTSTLGYGWTHSLDTRLIFPDDPGGREGVVLLKAHSANQYEFTINADGTYTPYPGMCGSFTRREGPPVTYAFVDSAQQVYTFDQTGKLVILSDARGHALHYTYRDTDSRLIRVSDDTGLRYLVLTYDAQARITSVSDHTGRQVRFSYDAVSGDLVSAADAIGQTWTYTYDPAHPHHLAQVIDPLGNIVERTEYDDQGRAVRQYNGKGELVVELAYKDFGLTIVRDGLSHPLTHVYNGRNAVARQTDAQGASTGKEYDFNFRPTALTDPISHTTRLAWSADGANLTQVVDAAGFTTTLSYDALNNLTRTVDARGFASTYDYSGTLLTRQTDALSNTSVYSYGLNNLLAAQQDPLGHVTRYGHDAFGQRTVVTDALGNATRYGYDNVGRLITTTDSLGRITVSTYDNADHLVAVTSNYTTTSSQQNYLDTYNLITRFGYDGFGRQVLVTDTLGRVTHNGYDAAGRLISSTVNYSPTVGQNYLNQYNLVTRYGYDMAGNQILVTDTLGFVTRTDYDVLNRPFRVMANYKDGLFDPARPDEDVISQTGYDPAGNPISQTDALGRVTRTWYDSLNRPISVTTNYAPGLPQNHNGEYNLVTRYTYDEVGNTYLVTDTLGHATRNYYDALGRVVSTTVNYSPAFGANYLNQYNLTTQYGYDKAGNRVVMTDPLGSAMHYAYDALNRVITTTDTLSGTTVTVYDALGNRIQTIDALGRTTVYTYDGANRLVATTDAAGQTTRYAYDALGNTRVVTDANGNPTYSTYDALNRLIVTTNALSGTTSYGYDALGRQAAITDANGHTTRTAYDGLGRPILTTDANGNQNVTVYDALGNRVREIDGLGNTTAYTYDALNRLVAHADPLGNVTRYGYDALGNRVVMTDANGIATRYGYDALNRLATVTENYTTTGLSDYQTNLVTRYAYDATGNRTVITNARGYTTTFAYDALYRPIAESDALGNTTRYGYDAVGNRSVMTDANTLAGTGGAVITYTYDAANRLIRIGYPDSSVTFAYDKVGNRRVMTDSVGVTRYTHDALYRLTTVTDPFNQPVGYAYDAAGNRTKLSYPDGKVVTYTFDAGDRLLTVQDWSGLFTRYDYDKANRLITTTLPNGVRSVNTYDAASRLLNLSHTAGAQLLSSFGYTYDKEGNRVRAVEQVRSDTPAEPAFVDVPFDHWAHDYIQAIYRERYVAGCNLLPLKYCPDVPITRAEIAVVMVRAVHGPDFVPPPASGAIFEDVPASHWAAKWIEQLWNDGYIAGCSETPRLYCPENPITRAEMAVLMVRVVHGAAFTPPAETGTVFDDVLPGVWWSKWIEQLAADGNTQGCSADRRLYCPARPLTRAEMAIFLVRALDIPLTPVPSGPYRVYLPLVARNFSGPALTTTVITYTYDPLYRLTGADYSSNKFFHYTYDPVGNRLIQQTLGVTNVYTYDAANRLTSVDGLAYTWDANGNLTGDGVRLYTYDHANRLTSVADELHAYTFAYNGLGDRLRQAVDGLPVSYTLDLNAGLTQVLAQGSSAYAYGLWRIGEEQPGGWVYHLPDALGSVRQLLDAWGDVALARAYEPFGDPLSTAGKVATPYGFTGEWTDATGLLHLRARYLNTATGRFLSRDATEGSSRVPLSINRYAYALANPVRLKDSTGYFPELPGPVAFAWCFELHSLLEGHYSLTVGDWVLEHNVSAQNAVDICKQAYSHDAWGFMQSTFNLDAPTPTTGHELFGWYLYEVGGRSRNHLWFDGRHPLTRELAQSWWIHLLRLKYYVFGDVRDPTEQRYNLPQNLASIVVDSRNSWYEFSVPVSWFLGSFKYQIRTIDNGERVGWRIDNDTTLESGTHVAGRFKEEGYGGSVEDLISSNPELQTMPLHQVINDPQYKPISILSSRERGDSDPTLGGGNMFETFSWTERRSCYNMLRPYPVALLFLDIQPWEGFRSQTRPVFEKE